MKKKSIKEELELLKKELEEAENNEKWDLVFLLLSRYNVLKMKESVILYQDPDSLQLQIDHLERLHEAQKHLYTGRTVNELMDASFFKKNLIPDLEKPQKEIRSLQKTLSVFKEYEL